MATKSDQLKSILQRLSTVGGIKASAVISANGLPMVSLMPEDVDPNTFAAMLASMVGSAETALKSLGSKNTLDRVVAESKDIRVVAVQAGTDAILTIMIDPNTNYGLILLESKKASDEIATVMKQSNFIILV
ncbi:MAG: Roadblock/LC7 family protein [Candidatus Parvarchaeum acidophilus ARMAN-5]|uniref:Roadblock/LC7 family protein n=1 Tax=Candidatus Parvarchaeum acidophilus ARMAN-5 TaxID=662762 RepID=D6GW20_PARA5|nr:MAG: Roadblock/LC7 family protein [Candidatus Parvarchaeum acidophilus ARMAN-5]